MSAMSNSGHAVPDVRTPRLFGILNIIFASGLLICGLCSSLYIFSLPALFKGMQQVTKQGEEQLRKQKQAELDALAESAKTAQTEEEKGEIETQRKIVEARPAPVMPVMDLKQFGLDDPMIIRWSWTETLSGIVLNVLLLVSGIGLTRNRSWGRSLGIWTAAAKIARLALLYSFFTLAVVPTMSKKVGEAVGAMIVQQQQAGGKAGGPPPTALLVRTYSIMYSLGGVGMIAVGSIYPAIALWFLTRPGVKLACAGTVKPRSERNEPW